MDTMVRLELEDARTSFHFVAYARTNQIFQIFRVEGRRIWGLTARILVDIARIALDREPEFECNSECKVHVAWESLY